MLLGLTAIVAGAFTVIIGAAMLAGFLPLEPVMVAVVVITGVGSAICAYLGSSRGPPVEMPGGETIFGAPRQPERPSPHRTIE